MPQLCLRVCGRTRAMCHAPVASPTTGQWTWLAVDLLFAAQTTRGKKLINSFINI